MGTEDYIIEIHKTMGEMSSDIKWIIQSRKEDLERINKYNDKKHLFRLYAGIAALPILISCGVFMTHLTKKVDILTAMHQTQMELFLQPDPKTGGLLPSGVKHGN